VCAGLAPTAIGVLTPPPGTALSDQTFAPFDSGATIGAGVTLAGSRPEALSAGATIGPSDAATVISGPRPTSDEAPTGADTELGTGSVGGALGADGSTGPLSVGQAFGWRYHILRLLGIGGMGAVYQAWDAELGVAVAIKVIRTEIMADPRAAAEVERRFKRELLLARQVTHKNVVRIHDLGEIDRVKYITMSYVEGTDLATILRTKGHPPIETVMQIARSIVSGLVAAHTAGVVHRDLKPANIMIDAEDQALIMDFGIANSTGVASMPQAPQVTLPARLRTSATSLQDTMHGAVVGTVQYMAPEQARGETVDQRADIYAFGLILYDLLADRPHEPGRNAIADLKARMQHGLPSVRTVAGQVPEPLDALITRCIQPDAAQRYQTTVELSAALDRLDDQGKLIPIKRTVGLPVAAAAAAALIALSGGFWWYTRPVPVVQHDPVSVVIADFENTTGDATFDRTLEPTFKRALEDVGFISAYDRSGISRTLGVRVPEKLDEAAASQVAINQGLGVVLSGSVERQGDGYAIAVKAAHAVAGGVITTARARASSKDEVMPAAARLISNVRQALGEGKPDSAQMATMVSLSATSLDVVGAYAAAVEASSRGNFEDSLKQADRAVQLDPDFGLGYQLMAIASRNLGRLQDADRYINEALRHLDGMTQRERYTTRGMFYRITGDYQQCVKEYSDLLARFAGDPAALNQLALCSTQLRDIPRALEAIRKLVAILPNRALFRDNLALYAAYAGDFPTAEQESKERPEPDPFAMLATAFAQIGQGQLAEARQSYDQLSRVNAQGASLAVSGLGDLAAHEGLYTEAIQTLERGVTADLAAKNPDRAAAKLVAMANAHLQRGHKAPAVAAAEKAVTTANSVKIRFLAGRTMAEAGEAAKARRLSAELAAETQAEPQAYAKIIEGNVLLEQKDARGAIKVLAEANTLLDTWIGRLDLGRAYLVAEQYPQADSEFDRCLKRRGEALALGLDEEPTYAYFPPTLYYQGRVREALKSTRFADSYRAYLSLRGKSKEDAIAADARKRVGS